MMTPTLTPLKYHGPGWRSVDCRGREYILWAPNETRPHWSASWEDDDGQHGDFRRGTSFTEVAPLLDPFTEAFAEAVRKLAEGTV
jgi:hypothetical protein